MYYTWIWNKKLNVDVRPTKDSLMYHIQQGDILP